MQVNYDINAIKYFNRLTALLQTKLANMIDFRKVNQPYSEKQELKEAVPQYETLLRKTFSDFLHICFNSFLVSTPVLPKCIESLHKTP